MTEEDRRAFGLLTFLGFRPNHSFGRRWAYNRGESAVRRSFSAYKIYGAFRTGNFDSQESLIKGALRRHT